MLINGLCAASPAGSWRHPCLDIADAQPCSGNCSYWGTDEYQATLDANPDIITIMLGTNDVRCVAETACATPLTKHTHASTRTYKHACTCTHARTHARNTHVSAIALGIDDGRAVALAACKYPTAAQHQYTSTHAVSHHFSH
jgi:hypothetical protein